MKPRTVIILLLMKVLDSQSSLVHLEHFIRLIGLGQLSQKGVYIKAVKKPPASRDFMCNSNTRGTVN